MKKLFIVLAVALMSTSSFAAKYGAAGCGLGSMVFEGDQTWWKQVLAGTTNGTGFQSVAITIGTSNCDAPTPFKVTSAHAYVEANKVALANDIARGDGETIVGLSKVYGCENAQNFGKDLKANYSSIFTQDATTLEVTNNISNVAASSCNTRI
ncbi:MAG TPA: DUF3015 family protein [Bacteriovoracaceae bacterium]|nr:DUF3015 family protein [Bacteriovoracaceae bacterium]